MGASALNRGTVIAKSFASPGDLSFVEVKHNIIPISEQGSKDDAVPDKHE